MPSKAQPSKPHPIRAARLRKKLTQAVLAEQIGVTKATVSGYENGRYVPSPSVARAISDALRISLDRIYAAEA